MTPNHALAHLSLTITLEVTTSQETETQKDSGIIFSFWLLKIKPLWAFVEVNIVEIHFYSPESVALTTYETAKWFYSVVVLLYIPTSNP